MKKLLGLLFTAPLVITSCGNSGITPEEIPGVEDPVENGGVSYALANGEFIYHKEDLAVVSDYFRTSDLISGDCADFNSTSQTNFRVLAGAGINDLGGGYFKDKAGDDGVFISYPEYRMPLNGYTFNITDVNGDPITAVATSSSFPGLCYTSGNIYMEATSSTTTGSNLAKAAVTIDADQRISDLSLTESELVNDKYIWNGSFDLVGMENHSHKIIDTNEARDILNAQAGNDIEWKYRNDNIGTEWYETVNAILSVFKGKTLEEAKAETLTGDWLPTNITGANKDLSYRMNYANMIVEAMENAINSTTYQ